MSDESLEKARTILIERILQSDIKQEDKLELAINIMTFLDNYKEHLKILQEHQKKR